MIIIIIIIDVLGRSGVAPLHQGGHGRRHVAVRQLVHPLAFASAKRGMERGGRLISLI